MTPLEAFREYLRLSCRLSLANEQGDIDAIRAKQAEAYFAVSRRSEGVIEFVCQEFQALEDAVENGGRVTYLAAFREYLRMSCELSEEVVKNKSGSEKADDISHFMTVPWYNMQDSSREVCGLVNEEFNRLEKKL